MRPTVRQLAGRRLTHRGRKLLGWSEGELKSAARCLIAEDMLNVVWLGTGAGRNQGWMSGATGTASASTHRPRGFVGDDPFACRVAPKGRSRSRFRRGRRGPTPRRGPCSESRWLHPYRSVQGPACGTYPLKVKGRNAGPQVDALFHHGGREADRTPCPSLGTAGGANLFVHLR